MPGTKVAGGAPDPCLQDMRIRVAPKKAAAASDRVPPGLAADYPVTVRAYEVRVCHHRPFDFYSLISGLLAVEITLAKLGRTFVDR